MPFVAMLLSRSLRRRLAAGRREVECDLSYEMVMGLGLIDDIGEQVGVLSHQQSGDLQKLIDAKQRRLQKLKEKAGVLGLSGDPALPIEIDGIEAEIERLQAELDRLV